MPRGLHGIAEPGTQVCGVHLAPGPVHHPSSPAARALHDSPLFSFNESSFKWDESGGVSVTKGGENTAEVEEDIQFLGRL